MINNNHTGIKIIDYNVWYYQNERITNTRTGKRVIIVIPNNTSPNIGNCTYTITIIYNLFHTQYDR